MAFKHISHRSLFYPFTFQVLNFFYSLHDQYSLWPNSVLNLVEATFSTKFQCRLMIQFGIVYFLSIYTARCISIISSIHTNFVRKRNGLSSFTLDFSCQEIKKYILFALRFSEQALCEKPCVHWAFTKANKNRLKMFHTKLRRIMTWMITQ